MGFAVLAEPPIVDPSNGNINLNARGGLTIVFQLQDASGVFLNIAGWVLWFEIAGLARVALTAGADVTSRLIVISAALAASLPLNTAVAFCVRDETGATPAIVWAGTIRTHGYGTAPP